MFCGLLKQYSFNVRSRGKQFFFPESPFVRQGKHQDSRENKTNWFPEGPHIKCFVIFLCFHFNILQLQQKNMLKWSQTRQLTWFLKEHKFNSQNHRMNDLQSTFLIFSASFSSTSCCFSSGVTLKIVAF